MQLALTVAAAARLIGLAGPDGGRDASARGLVTQLDPELHPLDPGASFDIDTPEQLRRFLDQGVPTA